jgi:hypothetical protein
LAYCGNVMIENRNGLVVDTELLQCNGTAERDAAMLCGFRRNWSTDSGGKWSAIPVGNGPGFRWEVVQFFGVTGMVDHLPECWTTWTGTVDQITGIGQ